MAGGSQAFATGVAAVVGTIVAVAAVGFVIWNATAEQRTQYLSQIEALNAKIGKTESAVASLQNAVAAQKPPSFDGIKASLADLNGKIEKTGAALADLKTMAPSSNATTDRTLGELKSALAAQQQTLTQISASLGALKADADKQKAAAATSSTAGMSVAKNEAKAPTEHDLVVVYMPRGAETAAPDAAAAPLSVRFDKIGSTNPGAQTPRLAADIKKIVAGRKGCVVSVSGFADTLGGDKVNLAVSRQRADAVAGGLRSALAGQDIEVKEVAWGERHLAVWTPDNKSERANRRVDISVDCKS
ncbi:MAG: hypothetical protein JSR61_11440 [Proteobacteria bacterium]|nr:hypothetical protein [Pseudomonadota bacterium]